MLICPVCQCTEFDKEEVLMTGKWSRFLNYSNKKYDAATCQNCGYTMLFRKKSKFNPFELLTG
tara:strand:+ start:905 stop:1093 length:189 start_codon:yes stop_codon:yes gene_type:complete